LDLYSRAKSEYANQSYITILDESISVGQQKLLLLLGCPYSLPQRPLQMSDMNILQMSVSPSWNGENIQNEMSKIIDNIGTAPIYAVSDRASNIAKALRLSGVTHHKDISHSIGAILKKHFCEDSDFKKFTKRMEKKRLEYHLTEKAYLLPPKQRSIARFMNCSDWVKWASDILNAFDRLSPEEQEAYRFVKRYKQLIEELDMIIDCANFVEALCKNNGLSYSIYDECKQAITNNLLNKPKMEKAHKVGEDFISYLTEELDLLSSKEDIHLISSDVIESTFGVYKQEKSPNKLCGVTGHLLILPLSAKMSSPEGRKDFDFKRAMEDVHYQDLFEWKAFNLIGNQVQDRHNRLRKEA
jgi:hypothetical protein